MLIQFLKLIQRLFDLKQIIKYAVLLPFMLRVFLKKKKLLEISSGNQYLFFSRHDIPQYYVHGHGERNKTY